MADQGMKEVVAVTASFGIRGADKLMQLRGGK